MARAVRHGETSTGEIIDIERFDGTHGTILNSAAPIEDRQGRRIGAVAVSQDITAWRAAEAALAERTEELELLNRVNRQLVGNQARALPRQRRVSPSGRTAALSAMPLKTPWDTR